MAADKKLDNLKRDFDKWIEENIKPLYKSRTKSFYGYELKIVDGNLSFNLPKIRQDRQVMMFVGIKNLVEKHELCLSSHFEEFLKQFLIKENGMYKIMDDTPFDDYFRSAFEDYTDVEIESISFINQYLTFERSISVRFNYDTNVGLLQKNKDNVYGIKFLNALNRFTQFQNKIFEFKVVTYDNFHFKFKIINTFKDDE